MAEFQSFTYPKPYDRKPSRSTYGYLISILLAAIAYILNEEGYNILLLTLPGLLGLTLSRYLDLGSIPVYGEAQQQLTINEKGITIDDITYPINEVREFKINFSTHHKKKVYNRYSFYYYLSGTENSLKVITSKGRIKSNFMIWNANHRMDLIKALEHYYEAGIFVKEGGRTYLGKDLSYEEVQDFKKHYKLKGNGY